MKKRILFPILGSTSLLLGAGTVTLLLVLTNTTETKVKPVVEGEQIHFQSNSKNALLYGENVQLTVGEQTKINFYGSLDFKDVQITSNLGKNSNFNDLNFVVDEDNSKNGYIIFKANNAFSNPEQILISANGYETLGLSVFTNTENLSIIDHPDDVDLSDDSIRINTNKNEKFTISGNAALKSFLFVSDMGKDSKITAGFEVSEEGNTGTLTLSANGEINNYETISIKFDGYNELILKVYTSSIKYDLEASINGNPITDGVVKLELGQEVSIQLHGDADLENVKIKSNKEGQSSISEMTFVQSKNSKKEGVLKLKADTAIPSDYEMITVSADNYHKLDLIVYTNLKQLSCKSDSGKSLVNNSISLTVGQKTRLSFDGEISFKNAKIEENNYDFNYLQYSDFVIDSNGKGYFELTALKKIILPEILIVKIDGYIPYFLYINSEFSTFNASINNTKINSSDIFTVDLDQTYKINLSGQIQFKNLKFSSVNGKDSEISKIEFGDSYISFTTGEVTLQNELFKISADGYTDFYIYLNSTVKNLSLEAYENVIVNSNNSIEIESNKVAKLKVKSSNKLENFTITSNDSNSILSFSVSKDPNNEKVNLISISSEDFSGSSSRTEGITIKASGNEDLKVSVKDVRKVSGTITFLDAPNGIFAGSTIEYDETIFVEKKYNKDSDGILITRNPTSDFYYEWVTLKIVNGISYSCSKNSSKNQSYIIKPKSENYSSSSHYAKLKIQSNDMFDDQYVGLDDKLVLYHADENYNATKNLLINDSTVYLKPGVEQNIFSKIRLDTTHWTLSSNSNSVVVSYIEHTNDTSNGQKNQFINFKTTSAAKSGDMALITISSNDVYGEDFHFYVKIL